MMGSDRHAAVRSIARISVLWGVAISVAIMFWVVSSVVDARGGQDYPPRALEVHELYFADGRFHQLVRPQSPETIVAQWAASITMDGALICSGGAQAPYSVIYEPLVMTPNQWTGDDCGVMPPRTYHATASWEWRDQYGMLHSISRDFDFTILAAE